MWRSLFGWHKEDLDLYSINYLHSGAPKFWYTVDLNSNDDFEDLAKRKFSESFRECPEFLRHKTTLIDPTTLIKNGIKLRKVVQKPREFVIARAAAYHAGFNSGFNIAEAVNFALDSWLDIGDNVSYCKCATDSVRIDMNLFRKRLRGEPVDDAKPQPEIKRSMCTVKVPPPKPEPKKVEPKKAAEPKKAEPKKAPKPKRVEPKKAEAKKPEPKKAAPKRKRDRKRQRKDDKKLNDVVKDGTPERKEGESKDEPKKAKAKVETKVVVKVKTIVTKPKVKPVEKKPAPPKKSPLPTPKTTSKPEPKPQSKTQPQKQPPAPKKKPSPVTVTIARRPHRPNIKDYEFFIKAIGATDE